MSENLCPACGCDLGRRGCPECGGAGYVPTEDGDCEPCFTCVLAAIRERRQLELHAAALAQPDPFAPEDHHAA